MKVVVLIDNNPHPELDLHTEHGLSIWFEADGYKWMLDVGASASFAANAVKLGIDISDIDYLVLSHGHNDHTGGLAEFLKLNQKAQIIMSSEIAEKHFVSLRTGQRRNISINHNMVHQHIDRFTFFDANMMLSKNVGFINNIPHPFDSPKANLNLFQVDEGNDVSDDFKHEGVLAIKRDNGLVVLSGCSHNGVLNILNTCTDFFSNTTVDVCIGGTHLLDSDNSNQYETDDEIAKIGKTIINLYPDMKLITGHCTGQNANIILSALMNGNFSTFHSGSTLEV
jgi:7,8-dihydropterin-6-yl-methyl-4-(beta-D-ribofuranosyl)aminobenzene 5'-phosphate synthase